MPALENTVAIVAGASSGIGHATALLFAREGAKVVVGARRRPELEQLVAAIISAGGQAVALAGDVADESFYKDELLNTRLEAMIESLDGRRRAA